MLGDAAEAEEEDGGEGEVGIPVKCWVRLV